MDKVIQTLSMCKRAGKLQLGFDVAKKAMQDGSAELIVVSSDLSPKTLKEVVYLTGQFELPMVTINQTLDELWYIIGKRAGVIAVTDYSLAKKIIANSQTTQQEEN